MTLTAKIVYELFDCDPLTGKLYWKRRASRWFATGRACSVWNAKHATKEAFTYKDCDGYFMGRIFGKSYFAHRIIYFHSYGWLPQEVDHLNGKPSDNRIMNLRAVTRAQNQQNRRLQHNNTSGYAGVYFDKQRKVWRGNVWHNGKKHSCGYSETKEGAHIAVLTKRKELGGFTERHGKA